MVRFLLALCLLPLGAFGLNATPDSRYSGGTIDAGDYYLLEDGSKVSLLRATGEIAIRFSQPITPEAAVNYVKAACSDVSVTLVNSSGDLPRGRFDVLHVADSASAIATLAQDPNVSFVQPVFISPPSFGRTMLSDEIVVGAKAGVSQEQIEQEMATLGLEFESRSKLSSPVYHFRVPAPTAERVLAAAVAASDKDGVRWAEPDFLCEVFIEPPTLSGQPALILPEGGASFHVTVDATEGSHEPLSVRITSLKKSVTSRASIVIEGEASQNATTLTFRIGSRVKAIPASTHWKFSATLPPGKITITVTASSPDGSTATDQISVRRK